VYHSGTGLVNPDLSPLLSLADDTSDAERHFEDATTEDPHWEPAVADLARYAIDRGDMARALSLLERTEDGPFTRRLPGTGLTAATRPADTAARNRHHRPRKWRPSDPATGRSSGARRR
jgi:hypothetical protein